MHAEGGPAPAAAGSSQWRRIRNPWLIASVVMVVAALAMATLLTSIVRRYAFLDDDWVFITERRDFSLALLLTTHNGHWLLIPTLLYQGALGLLGLTAIPLLAAANGLAHGLAAVSLFVALRHTRTAIAMLAGLALLLFTWSDEALLLPFNIVVVLPVAFGLLAFAAWDRQNPKPSTDALGAIALLAAFISGGAAVPVALVATATLAMTTSDRRRLAWPAVVWLVFATWFVLFAPSQGVLEATLSTGLDLLPPFIAHGLASLAAPAIGLDFRYREAALAIVMLLVGAGFAVVRPVRPAIWLALIAVVAWYTIIGLVRIGGHGVEGATAPRYLYPGMALLLLGAAILVDGALDRSTPRARRFIVVGVATWLLVALVGDLGKLGRSTVAYAAQAAEIRADLAAVEVLRPVVEGTAAAEVAINRDHFGGMPASTYYAAFDALRHAPPATARELVRLGSRQRTEVDALIDRLLGVTLRPALSDPPPPGTGEAIGSFHGLHDLRPATGSEGCAAFEVIGPDPFLEVVIGKGDHILLRTDGQRTLQVFARIVATEFGEVVHSMFPQAGRWYVVTPHELPGDLSWKLRLDPPPGSGRFEACVVHPALGTSLHSAEMSVRWIG
jgi:hypothetical protein